MPQRNHSSLIRRDQVRQKSSFARGTTLLLLGCVAFLATGSPARSEDRPLAEQVTRLIKELDADDPADREKAAERLIELGPAALPHVPTLGSKSLNAEQRRRLRGVIPKLWQAKLTGEMEGSVVTVEGDVSLSEAVRLARKQTGNPITDLREQFGQEVADPTIQLEDKQLPFWPFVDEVARQAKISYYHHTDDRSLGVVGRPGPSQPVDYAGAFRFALQRLTLETNYETGAQRPTCSLQFQTLVEPRLRPVLIEVDPAKFDIADDQKRPIAFANPMTRSFKVDAGSYEFPLTLQLIAPKRDAVAIAQLKGELGVWVPAHVEELEFSDLTVGKTQERSTAGLKVEIREITSDEGVWTFPVVVEQFTENATNIDSYLQNAFETEIFLKDKEGKRFAHNGGLSTLFSEQTRSGTEYIFVDAPGQLGDYTLCLRIPTGLTRVPITFGFHDLKLP